MKRLFALLLWAFLAPVDFLSAQTCFDVGTGADGPYQASSNTTLSGGTYNFTSFTIDAGVTVTVTGTDPLIIRCTGAVDIQGELRADGGDGIDGVTFSNAGIGGTGVAGGANGGDGSYDAVNGPIPALSGSGTGGAGNLGNDWSGGGGAGYATDGSASGNPTGGFAGLAYGTADIGDLFSGSGGGGGSGGLQCGGGGGGAGGGLIAIIAGTSITLAPAGVVSCNGGNGGSDGTGNCGGGGGGSGGTIWLAAPTVTNDGTVSAVGGLGGASAVPGSPYFGDGGNGADGRIRLDNDAPTSGSGTFAPPVGYSTGIPTLPLLANSAATDVTCFGDADGSVAATVSGGVAPYQYYWALTGDTLAALAGLPPGTYECVITDDAGCTASVSETVGEPAALVATIATDNEPTTCGGTDGNVSSTVSGGTGAYDYQWSNGETTANLNNVGAGTYSVTVTDANGCSQSAGPDTLNDPALPVVTLSLSIDSLCTGDAPIVLDGNTPSGGTFSGTGVSGNNFDPSVGAGDYLITYDYTDGNNCSASATDSIHVEICASLAAVDSRNHFFEIIPNPNRGRFLLINHDADGDTWFQLTNVTGQSLARWNIAGRESIDVSFLPAGVYFMLAESDGLRQVSRMIIE